MSKILFIGDPHLKITKFDLARKFLNWLNEIIESEKPDLVVNLGDTFDTHAVLRSEVMTEFMGHVDRTISTCPYTYLVGNHDQYKPNDSKYHALSHLKNKIKDFTIVDSVVDINGITYVPYTHDPSDFPKKTLPICVAHQTFKGADYGDIVTKDGVDANSLLQTEFIISGHIHKKQELDSGRVRIFYPGSPFSQSASDVDQIKGISILDTETLERKFFKCPLPVWSRLRYEIDASFDIDQLHASLEATVNEIDNWVIEITGPKAEISAYIDSKIYKQLILNKSIKLNTKFNDKTKKQIRLSALTIDAIVDQYIDKIYSGSLDKEDLKLKAKQIQQGSTLV